MMGRIPQCYIPSFVEIGLPFSEKMNFEGVLPYIGAANKLSFPLTKEAPHKFGFDWPSTFGGEDV